MAGMFDDLIPNQAAGATGQATASQSGGGMFDDLIPKQPQQPGGAMRNFAAGTIDAFTGTLPMFSDPGAGMDEMALSRALGLPDPSVPMGSPAQATHALNRGLGAVDLNPETVPTTTNTERLARAAGTGAAMVAGPELAFGKASSLLPLLLNTGKAGVVGGASGVGGVVGGDIGRNLAPERYKTAAEIAGNLIGGTLGGGGGALALEGPRAVMGASDYAARLFGPVTASSASRMAAERMATSATDPVAAAASLGKPLLLVPGSKPTTFQQAGDMGLGALERTVQTQNPAEFAQRRADQNAARVAQLDELQPTGNPADVPNYIRDRVRWLDQQTEQDISNATTVARQRADALGGNASPEQYGITMRAAAQDAANAARQRERALWNAVDPQGDLTINADPIRSAAQEIKQGLSKSAKPPDGDEARILGIAADYSPVVPFRDVGDLRSWVSDAMRTELRTNGQSQTYGRLSRLRGAVENAINSAVERQAQQNPDTLYNELTGYERAFVDPGNGQAISRSNRARVGQIGNDALGTGGPSPIQGTGSQSGGGFANAGSNSRLSSSSPVGARPLSFQKAVASLGGIRTLDAAGNHTPEGAEIANLLRGNSASGIVNNKTGLLPDEMRKRLQGAGWFGRSEQFGPTALAAGSHPGDSMDELYNLVDRAARGETVTHPEGPAATERYNPELHERNLRDRAASLGIQGSPGWTLQDWNAAINEREAMRDEAGTGPTFDPAAADRLRLATQATRNRADTYGRGPVGQVLAKAGRQDQYRLSDAAVPAKVFQPGPTGFESVQSYRRAVGDQQALPTLQDYAASSLRQYAGNADGILDPAKVQTWTQRHADALRAFPELKQRFSDAASASEAIGDAMSGRRSALDAYQTGVFSKLVGVSNPDDATRAIGGILNSQSRVQQMQQLAATARRDPNAFAGLRKGIANYIQDKFIGNTEATTSGQGSIKADAFQGFMRQNETALGSVFNPEEIASLKAIAADLQRSNRSLSAVKIPGQSNTAQDLAAMQGGQPSILKQLLFQAFGAAGGAAAGAATATGATLPAMAGWLGVKTLSAMRDAGMKRVDDVLREAMLNPELARALLAKVPPRPDTGTAVRLASALGRASLVGSALGTVAPRRGGPGSDASSLTDKLSSHVGTLLEPQGGPWQRSSAKPMPLLLAVP